jgi:hypothetical protein
MNPLFPGPKGSNIDNGPLPMSSCSHPHPVSMVWDGEKGFTSTHDLHTFRKDGKGHIKHKGK